MSSFVCQEENRKGQVTNAWKLAHVVCLGQLFTHFKYINPYSYQDDKLQTDHWTHEEAWDQQAVRWGRRSHDILRGSWLASFRMLVVSFLEHSILPAFLSCGYVNEDDDRLVYTWARTLNGWQTKSPNSSWSGKQDTNGQILALLAVRRAACDK